MNNRAIASLAVLKVNWDNRSDRKDYIEIFLPLFANLMIKKAYEKIDISLMQKDFEKEYGLHILWHPLQAIMDRARMKGMITLNSTKEYSPVMEKINIYGFEDRSNTLQNTYESIIDDFIKYSDTKYKVVLTKDIANAAFIIYLKEHDIEILLAGQEKTMLPDIYSESIETKFLMYSYIKQLYKSGDGKFGFIINIAVGHMLSLALYYNEFGIKEDLNNLKVYLDTSIIFRILGTQGEERKNAYIEFIKVLNENKAELFIFGHTYDEVMGILNGSLGWIEKGTYELYKANSVLKYFIQNAYTPSDIESFILNIDKILAEHKINKIETMSPKNNQEYQIDEKMLHEQILDGYKSNPRFSPEEKEYTILKDIKSISEIFKLRKGNQPETLQKCEHIFITANSGLAHISQKFEKSQKENTSFNIPVCVTDVFLGTLIWAYSPAQITSINEKKVISDCYAALQPNKLLLKKYSDEIKILRDKHDINEEEYLLLRGHRTSIELLEEKTMGEPEKFTDKTPMEILEEIKISIRREEEKKYLKEKENHSQTQELLNTEMKKREHADYQINNVDNNIEKIAVFASKIIGSISFILLITIVLLASYAGIFLYRNIFIRIAVFICIGLSIIIFRIYGFNIKMLGKRIREIAKGIIERILRKILGRTI